ncbi:60S ribosomal protein L20 [Aspergillus nanangensis]|uniref:60S ribosomal protein L20 n=1 Tax=Aspergillus nanangensis TaxID=2582783 RepID=A0AAD4CAA7_ASPNN|nr:60S ribosomal protein L20 [Aspergillus nanangensis]
MGAPQLPSVITQVVAEFREMSRTEAVEALYQDMAARHRARFGSIHLNEPRRTF